MPGGAEGTVRLDRTAPRRLRHSVERGTLASSQRAAAGNVTRVHEVGGSPERAHATPHWLWRPRDEAINVTALVSVYAGQKNKCVAAGP